MTAENIILILLAVAAVLLALWLILEVTSLVVIGAASEAYNDKTY